MNSKKVKKIRQLYRRDLRKKLMEESYILRLAFKGKPMILPRWLWLFGARLYIVKKYHSALFKK